MFAFKREYFDLCFILLMGHHSISSKACIEYFKSIVFKSFIRPRSTWSIFKIFIDNRFIAKFSNAIHRARILVKSIITMVYRKV